MSSLDNILCSIVILFLTVAVLFLGDKVYKTKVNNTDYLCISTSKKLDVNEVILIDGKQCLPLKKGKK